MLWVALGVVTFLAWSNGSNDNFKGVSTIYGSNSASYKTALAWATITQLAGSLLTLALAAGLVKTFSAKGLVPDPVATSPIFLGAAALGAGLTVLLATILGLPVSTTHGLTGALIGAGLATGVGVNLAVLGKTFVLPLLLSPVLAVGVSTALYPIARFARKRLGIERESCICIGDEFVPLRVATASAVSFSAEVVQLAINTGPGCERYQGVVAGLSAHRVLDSLHFLSAGAVCFARGLNDTPKIVALLIGAKALAGAAGLPLVAVAMAAGGLMGSRRVAETTTKITPLNAGQGFIASLTTAGLVIAASRFGLPVSTTHVATGSIFGIGAVTGQARMKTVSAILTAWVTTLPLGAALGAASLIALRALS